MSLLTIFTPTYNRAYILHELYDSLCKQTNKNFVWLIIDDGSIDKTDILVGKWIKHNKISIMYYKQENQGKHIAYNKAVELCKSKLFFCVDSDDRLSRDAVQIICTLYYKEMKSNILGFYMRRGDFNGNPVGKNWPTGIKYAFLNELYQKYGYKGETAIIFKTELIKRFMFPKFDNEKFVKESVLYDQINNIAPMCLDNRVCYLFEYQEDGYTSQGIKLDFKNPIGTGYYYLHHIKYTSSFIERCKLMGKFQAWQNVMMIDHPLYNTLLVPVSIRILGQMLKKHYKKLFTKFKKRLADEI